MGITGPLGKLYELPLIAQKKYWENRCMSNIIRTFAKKFFEGIDGKNMGKITDFCPIIVPQNGKLLKASTDYIRRGEVR